MLEPGAALADLADGAEAKRLKHGPRARGVWHGHHDLLARFCARVELWPLVRDIGLPAAKREPQRLVRGGEVARRVREIRVGVILDGARLAKEGTKGVQAIGRDPGLHFELDHADGRAPPPLQGPIHTPFCLGGVCRAVRAALASLVVLMVATSGCVDLEPSSIPDRLLEGAGGNGWEKNLTASQREPDSARWGLAKSQTLVYEDKRSDAGYPGTLTVTTLRTLMRPTESDVRDTVQEHIRQEAEARGLRIEGTASTGERRLANAEDSLWFVYNGSVQSSGTLFQSRDARVKIYGEVFECAASKSLVVVVGLAQITDVRRVGGVQLPSEEDPTTWREIAADPRGSLEGIRGSDGLAYNVAC